MGGVNGYSRRVPAGPDFREPLERLEAHIDNYNFDEAREPVAEIAGLPDITLKR